MADLGFWPQKTLYGVDESTASINEIVENNFSEHVDQIKEAMDVHGEHIFMQASQLQGADTFCNNDPDLLFNPVFDLPFVRFSSVKRMFKKRTEDFKMHPYMEDVMKYYEEGRQSGNLDPLNFNIPMHTVSDVDYFGQIRDDNAPCGVNVYDAIAKSNKFVHEGEHYVDRFAQSKLELPMSTRTPKMF